MQAKLYFHSPFSEERIYSQTDKALLLSFAMSELFTCMKEDSKDWALSSYKEKTYDAPLNKLQEHVNLLLVAFPKHKESLFDLKEKVSRLIFFISRSLSFNKQDHLKELFSLLEPLIKECKEDNHFLFFLLKNQKVLASLLDPSYLPDLFESLYGILELQTLLCDSFHKKGFTGLIPEIKLLFQDLQNKVSFA